MTMERHQMAIGRRLWQCRGVTWLWGGVKDEGEALKGDEKTFKDNKQMKMMTEKC